MRKERRSGVNQADTSGLAGAKPENPGNEFGQPKGNDEIEGETR